MACEARISGTPALLTDECGFDEVARVDGVQIVAAAVEGLQEGLVRILKDSARLSEMGSNLRRFVEDRYTWTSAAERCLALYPRILGRQGDAASFSRHERPQGIEKNISLPSSTRHGTPRACQRT